MQKDLTLLIPSYNKAPYIERALKSLAEQTYLYRTKILVGDDCSTDNSVEIIIQCAEKYGIEMDLYVNSENIGANDNFEKLYQSIDTEFYAILCSDDYYAHPERLERGVNFLKAHPDYSMHACNFYCQRQDGELFPAISPEKNSQTLTSYFDMPFFQACVPVFRNFWNAEKDPSRREQLLGYRESNACNDPLANFVAIHYGKCYFENFFGSVYWINEFNGAWSSYSPVEKCIVSVFSRLVLAEVSKDFFHNRDEVRNFIQLAVEYYFQVVEHLSVLLRNLSASDFKVSESFSCGFLGDISPELLRSNDIKNVFDLMIDLESKLKSFGFDIEIVER